MASYAFPLNHCTEMIAIAATHLRTFTVLTSENQIIYKGERAKVLTPHTSGYHLLNMNSNLQYHVPTFFITGSAEVRSFNQMIMIQEIGDIDGWLKRCASF